MRDTEQLIEADPPKMKYQSYHEALHEASQREIDRITANLRAAGISEDDEARVIKRGYKPQSESIWDLRSVLIFVAVAFAAGIVVMTNFGSYTPIKFFVPAIISGTIIEVFHYCREKLKS